MTAPHRALLRVLSSLMLLALSLAPFESCAGGAFDQVLEFKDVLGFKAKEVREGGARFLRLKGTAFHSALVVDGVETVVEGDRLRVRVLLWIVSKGRSGSFDVLVDIPPGVRTVIFGNEGARIWPLDPSPKEPKEPAAP